MPDRSEDVADDTDLGERDTTDPAEARTAAEDPRPRGARRQLREPKAGSRMTEQEQRWGRWLGLGSAAAFGVLAQPWLGGEHLAQAGLGVAMGMLLWSVARQGFRIRTAVASYLFLFAFGDLFIFGALHIGYAFLLAFRASREMGQARADERARERKARASTADARPARRRRAKAKKSASEADPASPPPLRVTEANRRYTPPKPKRKRRR